MNVTAKVELTDKQAKYLCHHSIERAINLALEIAERSRHPDAQTVIDDLTDIKPIATRLWTAAHSDIFEQLNTK
jgi:hypothetical protein